MHKLVIIFAGFIMLSSAVFAEPIITESTSTSNVTTQGKTETTVKSPPPSAISPAINGSRS